MSRRRGCCRRVRSELPDPAEGSLSLAQPTTAVATTAARSSKGVIMPAVAGGPLIPHGMRTSWHLPRAYPLWELARLVCASATMPDARSARSPTAAYPSRRAAGPFSSSAVKPASSSTGTPSCSALSALEPAFSPTTTKSVFLETEPAALPPRPGSPPGGVAAVAVQGAGDHDGQALQGAGRRLVALVGHRDAGRRPLLDDLGVPVDLEPLDDGRGDRRADALGGGELLLGGRADRRPWSRTPWASARDALGPTWRIESATRTRHSGTSLRESRLSRSRWPLADEDRGRPSSAFFAARVNSSVRSSWSALEVEDVALVGDHLRVEQRGGRLVAQALDVEGAAPGHEVDALADLAGAALVVGAAQVLVALLLLGERGAAGGALVGITHLRQALGSQRRAPARRSRGSRRRPCAGSRCHRGARPCARTSWALCSVAFSTVEPATRVGSMTPYGVTRPVRPTLTSMESSLALTSSGGYLNAIAHRGARLVEPEPALERDVVDLHDDAVDLVGDDRVPSLPRVGDEGLDLPQRGDHPDRLAGREAPGRSAS